MIRVSTDRDPSNYVMFYRDMPLAHAYCVGKGIELCAGAHNPFYLPGSVNVAPTRGTDDFWELQIKVCGASAEVDVWSDLETFADHFPEASQDYVLSSHVLQTVRNLYAVLEQCEKVLKEGGTLFTIIPKYNAFSKPITHVAYELVVHDDMGERDLEYHLFTAESFVEAVQQRFPRWQLLEVEQTDSKVGNGHTVVFRVRKAIEPRELAEGEILDTITLGEPISDEDAATLPPAEVEVISGENPFASRTFPAPSKVKKTAT